MRKKCLLFLVAALLIVLIATPAQAKTPSVTLNGKILNCSTPPIIDNGSTLVPMRTIFEALGASVKWDASSKTVTATKGSTKIQLVIGGQAYRNGAKVNLNTPAQLYQGNTMVPLRFVSEALGASVKWDGSTSTVKITSSGAPAPAPAKPAPQSQPKQTETSTSKNPGTSANKSAAKTPFEKYLDGMHARFLPDKAKGKSITYQFIINEGHPGKYYVSIKDGKLSTGEGTVSSPSVTITVGEQLWLDIAAGKVNGTTAYLTKKFKVNGNPLLVQEMEKYFRKE
ncbi:stalk domain-containing protein [Desulfotruncus alcoholivorax]|uniref:stalk domain-containing protein n=1 Tax=Desulfotruncus alcoholivorax TaxID=265477 RepID=UPI000424B8BB|nr:stalk domain-containing protein [Desulfotruncus alcoholivorax]